MEIEPHFVITDTNCNAHVIPESAIIAISKGEKDITELEQYQLILPTIIREWAYLVEERNKREKADDAKRN
jgi:hypothetical protein